MHDIAFDVQTGGYPLPADRVQTVVQRIQICHGVSCDLARLLLEDIKRAIAHLSQNPVPHSIANPSFHHGA